MYAYLAEDWMIFLITILVVYTGLFNHEAMIAIHFNCQIVILCCDHSWIQCHHPSMYNLGDIIFTSPNYSMSSETLYISIEGLLSLFNP